MQIEVGKFYRTEGGEKVGPMEYYGITHFGYEAMSCKGDLFRKSDGKCYPDSYGKSYDTENDIIAEWTEDAPAEEIVWGEWGPLRVLEFPRQSQNLDGKETLWRYPVKREPVMETVVLYGNAAYRDEWTDYACGDDTHRITLTIIDGIVQPTATVEAI